jgi:GTPase SAR1 family protein
LLARGPGTEKARLIRKFIMNRFAANYRLTIGVDILTKDVEFKPGEIANLSIGDIGRQQRFNFI